MAITGSEKAYTYARSGIARSGATRSNYVTAWTTVDLIVRDGAGQIVSRTDISLYIRQGSLTVSQALNDEPDTCSFQIVPTAPPSAVPQIGQEIAVAWTAGDVLFQGYVLVEQFDRRPMNESPWVSIQCQDAMWRFDARIVTFRFPAQSVTKSIATLLVWFCDTPNATFRTTFVHPDLPSIGAVDVVNQRPSTVMRTLMAAVGGAFYIDGLDVHAWAGDLSEPGQSTPQPLTNALASLKSFRVTRDATQLRRGVLVEGRRTSTLIGLPTIDAGAALPIGIPLGDASLFPALGDEYEHLARLGTQWVRLLIPVSVRAAGANPPQTQLKTAFTPGDGVLICEALATAPPFQGWIRIGNQYAAYAASDTDVGTSTLNLQLALPTHPYGQLTVPMPVGETVEWVDCVMRDYAHGLGWVDPTVQSQVVAAQPTDTDLVTLAVAQRTLDGWPPLEGFVQDGRYSYPGALARAEADLEAFAAPLMSAEWETEDLNAQPGRRQAIHLTGTSVIDPLDLTVTITTVELSFPLRTELPRRRCTGGDVKPSTFLDLVLTDDS